jgi:hypothetical protein
MDTLGSYEPKQMTAREVQAKLQAAMTQHALYVEQAPPPSGSPVELALQGVANMTGQLMCMVDELTGRLAAGGILQDIKVDAAPAVSLPPPSCGVVSCLNDNTRQLEQMMQHLASLVQRLAV